MLLLLLCLFSFDSILAKPTNVGIINGTNADIADFPWMVSVYDKQFGFMCGGSLLSPNWVLTAGHCADGNILNRISAGSSSLVDNQATFVNIDKVIVHPNFTQDDEGVPANDLTLLHLSSSVNGTNIAPIRLPEPNAPIPEGKLVTVSGWGDTTGRGTYANDLQYAIIEVPTVKQCQEAYAKYNLKVNPEFGYCAGTIGDTKGTCHGDSGSAAHINGTIVGMVSWGLDGCSTSKMPVVLVDVANYAKWIQDVINSY